EAEAFHDLERAARARRELEAVEREVAELLGEDTAGLDGDAAANAERARVNVTRALRSTIKRIAARAPRVGRYLDLSVQTGASCVFTPPPDFELITRPPDAPKPTPVLQDAHGRAKRALVWVEL